MTEKVLDDTGSAAWTGIQSKMAQRPGRLSYRLILCALGGSEEEAVLRVAIGHLSQSELDFAYAKRALLRGEPAEAVAAAIARYRDGDKTDVLDYAARTVRNAASQLHLNGRPGCAT